MRTTSLSSRSIQVKSWWNTSTRLAKIMERTPNEIAERRVELSAEYSKCADELADILEVKATAWLGIRGREEIKSDTRADKEWDATELGIQEMRLRLRMKGLEKKLSAAKSYLDVANNEARNLY